VDFLIGAIVTIIAYSVSQRIIRKSLPKDEGISTINYSQSHIYDLMRPFLEFADVVSSDVPSQSINYLKNAYMKVMVVNSKAYWIKNNTFYVADVVEGEVKKETTKEVDTMAMNKVELNEMLFIVEKLREESDDNRGSGK
jgi:hypothetical protein